MEFLKVLSPVIYDGTHLYQGCLSFSFYTISNISLRFITCNLIIFWWLSTRDSRHFAVLENREKTGLFEAKTYIGAEGGGGGDGN